MMAKLYILIKRKGAKRYLGAIPTKKGATVRKLKSLISGQVKRGFSARIVTASQLKRVIALQAPRKLRKVLRRRKVLKKRRKVKR